MILADKIIAQRKKNGWSQEELAEKMNVSRQAVSKWEAAQTTPDLKKILRLGKLFGVTTDYLLKDEIETEVFTEDAEEAPIRKITLAEANEYLAQRKDASVKIAIATFLCMVSIIPLLLLSAAEEFSSLPITENTAVGIGVIVLFFHGRRRSGDVHAGRFPKCTLCVFGNGSLSRGIWCRRLREGQTKSISQYLCEI